MSNESFKDNNALSRMARYGRVSTTMAGLAARLAGERYFGFKIERADHAQQLTEALGNLKGPLMKVGQILSTIPEALPPEYAQAFQSLQSNAPPMNRAFVRRRMRTELGADWESFFTSFDQDPAAAASLGQVHRAVTLGGQHVACKLQYPDMESAVEADLKQLKIIFSIFEKYDRTISTQHIHAELKDRLKEELDYTQEAAHCRLYEFMLRHENSVHVPVINENLSTHRLLTTNWLDGKPILEYKNADLEIRNRLAMNMFRAWYVPLYHYGVIHGDPHLGNYSVCDNQDINLMDFGCIRIFPARFIGGVIDLYHALMDDDKARAVQAYETWGFTGLTHDQIDTLNIWARFLYAPVMDDKVRTIGETSNGVYGRETAEKVHKKLKELGGGINVPREFVFMDRAALGLGSVFIHLQAEVNWYRLFNEMIDGFNVDRLHETQQSALQQFGLTSPLS